MAARAASERVGTVARPSPSATVAASGSSTLSRLATIRSRMSTRSTLLSSNTKRVAMWLLLDLGLADVELPGLAVVVGEASRGAAGASRPPPRLGNDA